MKNTTPLTGTDEERIEKYYWLREILKEQQFGIALLILAILSIFCLMLVMFLPVLASEGTSILIHHEHEQATVHVYQAALGNEDSGYTLSESFAPSKMDFNALEVHQYPDAASDLHEFIQKTQIEPDWEIELDETGSARLDGIEEGIFLITGPEYRHKDTSYYVNPTLIKAKEGSAQSIALKARVFAAEEQRLSVQKIWLDDKGNPTPPETGSIEVRLLKNGSEYARTILSEENDWSHSWFVSPNDENHNKINWTIEELTQLPAYQTEISWQEEDNQFTIVNRKKPDGTPGDTDDPKRPGNSDPPGNSNQSNGSGNQDPSGPNSTNKQDPSKNGNLDTGASTKWQIPFTVVVISLFAILGLYEKKKYRENLERKRIRKSLSKPRKHPKWRE